MTAYKDTHDGVYKIASIIDEHMLPPGCVAITDAEYLALIATIPTTSQIIAIGEAATQSFLDSIAQLWGYDSMLSAASYATSYVAKFKSESELLIAWRDSVWVAAIAIETAVPLVLPTTVTDLLALFPPAPVKP